MSMNCLNSRFKKERRSSKYDSPLEKRKRKESNRLLKAPSSAAEITSKPNVNNGNTPEPAMIELCTKRRMILLIAFLGG